MEAEITYRTKDTIMIDWSKPIIKFSGLNECFTMDCESKIEELIKKII